MIVTWKKKTIQKTVYLAKDGKEFLNKEECRKYEEEFLDKVSYFAISYNFDLTEGRGFQSLVYVAVVPSRNDSAAVIANKYAIDVLNDGVFAGQGCQGYGLQEAYAALIDKISGKGTWEGNPWVFVYDFELVK